MPSTYSPNLRFELIATGEQAGTWGGTTNTNIGTLIEQAIAGAVTVTMTDADLTLTTNSGASDQARNMHVILTSGVSLTTTRTVTCPAVSKFYVVRNATAGGQSVLFTAGGTGVTILNGNTVALVCDGTNVRLAHDAVTLTANGVEQLRATTLGVTLPGGYLSAQPSFRNKIINGAFDFWQRGTSQTSNGYGSDDRWENSNVGSSKTASRQSFTLGQTDVPGDPTYFSRTVVASVAGASNYVFKRQAIENVRTFAGRSIRVSFYAKADASRPIAIELAQSFGTGGSPSAAVTGIGAQKFTLTTSWVRYEATISVPSLSGKTLGSNNDDYLGLYIWFDAGSSFNARTASLGQQSGTFDIAMVQVEEGTAATPFERRPFAVELAQCQRYFVSIASLIVSGYAGGADEALYGDFIHPVSMRATPTVTYTNVNSGNAKTNPATNYGDNVHTRVAFTTNAAGAAFFVFNATFSAEL